jgi:hypothetical protein
MMSKHDFFYFIFGYSYPITQCIHRHILLVLYISHSSDIGYGGFSLEIFESLTLDEIESNKCL